MGTNENINNINGNIINPEKVPNNATIPNTGGVTDDTIVVDFQATQRINIISELMKMQEQQTVKNHQGTIASQNETVVDNNIISLSKTKNETVVDNNIISLSKTKNETAENILNSSSENSTEQIAQQENSSNTSLLNENVLKTPNEIIVQSNIENTQTVQQGDELQDVVQINAELQNIEQQNNMRRSIEIQNAVEQGVDAQKIDSQKDAEQSAEVQNVESQNVVGQDNKVQKVEPYNDTNQSINIQSIESQNMEKTGIQNVNQNSIEQNNTETESLTDKEKQHAQDKKDYRLERMLFDRINTMQGKIKESIELIQKFERINAKEENLPNIVTTLHDKLTHEVIKQFRTVGIEFNMKSYLVQSVVSDLLSKFEEGISEFRDCSENLNFVREVQDDFESRVELAPTSKVKNIFARLRGMFKPERKQEKLEEMERERQKKKLDEANIHLMRYKFINGELERYTIKDNIVNSLSREIMHGQSSGQNLNVTDFVSEKIATEMQKLGLEGLIPNLLQNLYGEYKEKDTNISVEDFAHLQVSEIRRNMKVKNIDVLKSKVNAVVTNNETKIEIEDDERMVV